jgi:hypothetical protein
MLSKLVFIVIMTSVKFLESIIIFYHYLLLKILLKILTIKMRYAIINFSN